MAPRFDDDDVAAAVAAAMDLVDTDLTVRVNKETAYIGKTTITRWIDSSLVDGEIVPVFNEARVTESLERLLDGYTTPFPQPVYLVRRQRSHLRSRRRSGGAVLRHGATELLVPRG